MESDTTQITQKEIEDLLKKALKNIEHAHLDELLAIEKELEVAKVESDDTDAKIKTLSEQLS
ncbi:MAG: hypothetical protein KBC21_01935 [Candidatus Pacebacteria bacterium]|nr:hypothetical protein [Candidatus Paceibacterota bacterium]